MSLNLILSLILIFAFILSYGLMVQIFTVLFRLTGLTRDKSRFQVISLLTNSGYTTQEAELVTCNASRRKIAKVAMVTGSAFNLIIGSLFINLLFSIVTLTSEQITDDLANFYIALGVSVAVFIFLLILFKIPIVSRGLIKLIENIAMKVNKKRHHENIITQLDSYGKNSICEIYVAQVPDEIKEKTMQDSPLKSKYNITVLLIKRGDRIVNVSKDTIIQKGDNVVVFGKDVNIKNLFYIEKHHKASEENIDDSLINNVAIIDNYGANALSEIEVRSVPEVLKDKTLLESPIKEQYDINILMVKRDDKVILTDAETKVMTGDKIVLIGPYENVKALFVNEKE